MFNNYCFFCEEFKDVTIIDVDDVDVDGNVYICSTCEDSLNQKVIK